MTPALPWRKTRSFGTTRISTRPLLSNSRRWRREEKRVVLVMFPSVSAKPLVLHQFPQYTGGAGFLGTKRFEPAGQIVGQFHRQRALGHVAVVVGDVEGQVRQHLVGLHV